MSPTTATRAVAVRRPTPGTVSRRPMRGDCRARAASWRSIAWMRASRSWMSAQASASGGCSAEGTEAASLVSRVWMCGTRANRKGDPWRRHGRSYCAGCRDGPHVAGVGGHDARGPEAAGPSGGPSRRPPGARWRGAARRRTARAANARADGARRRDQLAGIGRSRGRTWTSQRRSSSGALHRMINTGDDVLRLVYFWWAPNGDRQVLQVASALLERVPEQPAKAKFPD